MSKNQARNIELEIKKLEAKESRELLGIIQVCPKFHTLNFLQWKSAEIVTYPALSPSNLCRVR